MCGSGPAPLVIKGVARTSGKTRMEWKVRWHLAVSMFISELGGLYCVRVKDALARSTLKYSG